MEDDQRSFAGSAMTAHWVGRTTGGTAGGTVGHDWLWSALARAEHVDLPFFGRPMKPGSRINAAATESRSFPAEPESVKAARDFTVTALRDWGMQRLADEMCLVVSELVTNALHHAPPIHAVPDAEGPIRLSLILRGDEIICAVRDCGSDVPFRKDPQHVAETGRGLLLVESFSRAWGWTPLRGSGKVVWALFTQPG
jgi:anti-sigma regulatory factor (Ser/Thr protein kinase)